MGRGKELGTVGDVNHGSEIQVQFPALPGQWQVECGQTMFWRASGTALLGG